MYGVGCIYPKPWYCGTIAINRSILSTYTVPNHAIDHGDGGYKICGLLLFLSVFQTIRLRKIRSGLWVYALKKEGRVSVDPSIGVVFVDLAVFVCYSRVSSLSLVLFSNPGTGLPLLSALREAKVPAVEFIWRIVDSAKEASVLTRFSF
uniref:Uncharacterized protein n=1 Tax=Nelumbo nucifera TaxID=4432 RepID=A0A822XXX6_NELNU|nr:TPA_asm: hypothetical protein HUJ06_025422 [Nelumbo nucifera]